MSRVDLEEVIEQVIETLLWSETDDRGEPLDETYGPHDVHPDSLAWVRELVGGFVTSCQEERPDVFEDLGPADIGHNYVLSANGHGAGFWDRGLGERGDWLHKNAKGGSLDAYIGDDGLVYVS